MNTKNNLTVLYVEDDEVVRENFQQILHSFFSNVFVTENGKTAMEIFLQQPIDLVLLDISIPGMNGLEVARNIRKINDTVKIIILTAYSDREKLLKAVNLQLFAYLVKPTQYKQFVEILQKAISSINQLSKIDFSYGYNWHAETKQLFYKDELMPMTKNEQKIVNFLYQNNRKYFTACKISELIFEDYDSNDYQCNNIVQLISRFKSKLSKKNKVINFFIKSAYGSGYRLLISSDESK